MYYLTVSIIQD